MKTLLAVGAFYKDNSPDGFSIVLNRDTFGDAFDLIVNSAQEMTDAFNKQDKVDLKDVVAQTEDEVMPTLRMKMFGKDEYPQDKMGVEKEIGIDADMAIALTVFLSNVQILAEHGVIPNDNHNGMQYAYGG